MYYVELIPKESTLKDIIGPWVNSGRDDNRKDGAFVFTNVDVAKAEYGSIEIIKGDHVYIYNQADFYRVKITKCEG